MNSLIKAVSRQRTYRKQRVPLRKLSLLMFFVLVVQLCRFDVPIGMLTGIPSQLWNIIIAGLMALYVASNIGSVTYLMKQKTVRLWTFLILISPILIIQVQYLSGKIEKADSLYWSGYNIITFIGFFTCMVFSYRENTTLVCKIYLYSLIGCALGFVVQKVNYSFIRRALEYAKSDIAASDVYDRMVGFFAHPNTAAISILIYGLFFRLTYKGRFKAVTNNFVSIFSLILIFLAGSRTSMILWVLSHSMIVFRYAISSTSVSSFNQRVIAISFAAWLSCFAAIAIVNTAASSASFQRINDLVDTLSGSGKVDESTEIRQRVLWEYLLYSMTNPLLGSGPQATQKLIEIGEFTNVSQNFWIQSAVELGYCYTALIGIILTRTLFLFRIHRKKNRYVNEIYYSFLIFFVVFLVSALSFVQMFYIKALAFTLAFHVGILARELVKARRHNTNPSNSPVDEQKNIKVGHTSPAFRDELVGLKWE